jgi:DNA-binding transcriptional LysR family regulator
MQLSDRIGRRIKLHDVHVLMAVVQAGSMNKAAALLNTTQSAISRSIADLESAIGVKLLDRTSQGVEPTDYGRALLDGGAAVFDDLRQTVKSIEFLSDPSAGDVRIGCHLFLAASFVSAAIDRIRQRHPRIVFHLVIAEVETLLRELSARRVDLLITRLWRPIVAEQLSFEFLFEDSFCVVAGPKNPWYRRRGFALADLVNESWVLPPPETGFAAAAMAAFRSYGLDYPRTTVVALPPDVRASLLATGHFLSIFPTSALRFPTKRPELKVLPVELPMARVPNGIVTLKNRTLGPVAQLFIDSAREVAKAPARKKSR